MKNLPMKGGTGGVQRLDSARACAVGRRQRADGRHPAQAPAVCRSRARESRGAGRRRTLARGWTDGGRPLRSGRRCS
jgi:hypothetical protein